MEQPRASRWPLWLGGLLIGTLALLSMWHELMQERAQAAERLQAVAELRRVQIDAWLDSALQQGQVLAASPVWARLFEESANTGAQPLLQRAVAFRKSFGGVAALVLDSQGQLLQAEAGASAEATALSGPLRSVAAAALASGQVQHTGLYRQNGLAAALRLDIVIPLRGAGLPAPAAVVFRIDPMAPLRPLLQAWPVPSASGETLLWAREGDAAVALSGWRNPARAAPVSLRSAAPISRVLRGEVAPGAVFHGQAVDGRAVMAVALPVAGASAQLMANIDLAEVDARARRSAGWIAGAALALWLALWLALRQAAQRQAMLLAQAEGESQLGELEATVQSRTFELRAANASLAEAERFTRLISDSLPGRVAYWDAELRCRYANRAWCDGVGQPPDAVQGRTARALLGEARWAQLAGPLQAALAGSEQHVEQPLGRTAEAAGGEAGMLAQVQQIHLQPDLRDGRVVGVFSMAFDISALKQAEAQLRQALQAAEAASRAKSVFLANMSHELRTPLNAITGLAHLLRRQSHDPQAQDRIDKLSAAARHLLALLGDLLDLSRIEAGKLTLDDRVFNLGELLDQAAAEVAEQARGKGLELVVDADHLPPSLRGDPARLMRALQALLSNALKFTAQGWVRLRAEPVGDEAGGLLVRFEVRDTGIGIPPAQQAALFQPFEQADSSATRRFGGSGLGLALTHRLARLMGGEAGLSSVPGEGSSFWFTARLGRVAQAPAQPPLPALRVLLVDDLAESRLALRDRLELLGLQVDMEASGEAALSRLQRSLQQAGAPYGLLVIDWRMAPLDGIATLQGMRALLGGQLPPSLLVSAQDDAALLQAASQAGFAAVLVKPVSATLLRDTLQRLLQRPAPPAPPAAAAEAPPALLLPPPASGPAEAALRQWPRAARVLLADDNPVNLEVAAALLQAVGLQVLLATDGAAAVVLALQERPDLVLMDVQMPGMDGLAATRAIRLGMGQASGLASGNRLPILALTANAFGEDRAACLAAGMDDHLAKPVDPEQLYAALQRWLPREAQGSAAPAPATAEAAAAPAASALLQRLATVPGLDLAEVLERLAQRESLLARVLQQFVRQYADGVPALLAPEALPAQRQQAAHSLRGAAATIGALALQQQLQAFEQGIAAGLDDGALLARAQRLDASLRALVAALRQALAAPD